MSHVLTLPEIGIVIDNVYRNYNKSYIEQKNLRDLAKDCGISSNTLQEIKKILVAMGLLIVYGERRSQRTYWNEEKSKPNPVMLSEVYRVFTKDIKSRIRVSIKKERRLPSFETALLVIKKAGWDEIILRKSSSYKEVTEKYNLKEMGEKE